MKEEATTEVETTVDANQEAYNEIINLEKNIVSFGEKSLPNGFVDLNESNKLEMAKLFTNAYIQMNSSTINKKSHFKSKTYRKTCHHNWCKIQFLRSRFRFSIS